MTGLVWGDLLDRRYDFGVDRGVLFPRLTAGVAWDGLVSVQETYVGGEVDSRYFDGIKYLDFKTNKDFQASVSAFSYPNAFRECIGQRSVSAGFILTRQMRLPFDFSYRTMVGGNDKYKIHLVYNVTASPTQRGYATIDNEAQLQALQWTFDCVPPLSSTYKPSAHFTIDSMTTDPAVLADLEDILYGSSGGDAEMPTQADVIALFGGV